MGLLSFTPVYTIAYPCLQLVEQQEVLSWTDVTHTHTHARTHTHTHTHTEVWVHWCQRLNTHTLSGGNFGLICASVIRSAAVELST